VVALFDTLAETIRLPEWADLPWAWEWKSALLRKTGLRIGARAIVAAGFVCLHRNRRDIEMEDDVILGYNNRILGNAPIRLGRFTLCSMDVTFSNDSGAAGNPRPQTIGPGCWIGTGAKVIGAVTLGSNAIVAAGAVVTEDVASCSIVAGIPARVLSTRELPERVWNRPNRYFCPRTFTPVDAPGA
jgi:acetyltransferase-like isoleucine patch superfamily enzyme